MSIDFVRPDGLYPHVPYAYAAIAPAGRLVFTAGACPLDDAGRTVAPGDLEAQTARTAENLAAALRAAGSDLDHVLKTTIYVVAATPADLVRAWTVVKDAFGDADPPSTLLGVAMLGYSDQLVEIEAVATITG